jgi:hypothetical protein
MKTYNRALDNMALAANHYLQGNEIVAAAFFLKAATSPDVTQAIAIIEASNAQAYEAASTKPAAKAPVRAAAKKQITAGERKQLAALVGAEVVIAEFGEEVEPEAAEDEGIEKEDEEDGVGSFAQALAALKKKK